MIRAMITVSRRLYETEGFLRMVKAKTLPGIVSALNRRHNTQLGINDFKTLVSPEGDKMEITFYATTQN